MIPPLLRPGWMEEFSPSDLKKTDPKEVSPGSVKSMRFPARFDRPFNPYGFTNFSVMRSDSPMAAYRPRSFAPSAKLGGRVHTPLG